MEVHRKECPLEDVVCSIYCGKILYLAVHIEPECPCRNVDCQYCHITGEHQFVHSEMHRMFCPKLPLPCPNKCEVGSVPREAMEVHRKECPLEMVQCEYHNVGCEERMMRKELEKHNKENIEKHLSITNSKLADVTSQLSTAVNTLMVVMHHHTGVSFLPLVLIGPQSQLQSIQ